MPNIKLIVTDLDDTLLKSDKSISSLTRDTVHEVRKSGVKFAFATARGPSTQHLVDRALFDAYIQMNGARVFAEGQLIHQCLIDPAIYLPLLRTLEAKKIRAGVEIDQEHYANFDVLTIFKNESGYVRTDFADFEAKPADKLYAFAYNEKELEEIKTVLPESLYMKIARDGMIMIMHKDATKIRAIEHLASHYGFTLDEVAAFGDDVNDIDMIEKVGRGIAMANAVPELKAVADEICGSNEDDGVANWMQVHLLGECL